MIAAIDSGTGTLPDPVPGAAAPQPATASATTRTQALMNIKRGLTGARNTTKRSAGEVANLEVGCSHGG